MSNLEPQLKLLKNPAANPLERRAAAAALNGSDDPRHREALRRAASDPHWVVRAEALRALHETGAITAALNDPLLAIREQAPDLLAEARFDAAAVVPFLTAEDTRLRRAAALALGRLGDEQIAEELRKRQGPGGERDPEVLLAIAAAITQISLAWLPEPSVPEISTDYLPRPEG